VSDEQGKNILLYQNTARNQGEASPIRNSNCGGGETYLKYVARENKNDGSKKQ